MPTILDGVPSTLLGAGRSVGVSLTDIQLEFPALIALAANAPQLKSADLGHVALERHRNHLVVPGLVSAMKPK